MSLARIKAVFLQGIYLAKSSLEHWFDLVFFSLMNVILFGLIGRLFGGSNQAGAYYVLIGVLFWELIRINQYALSVGSLWNIWSKNLSNVFISPVTAPEYFSAYMLTAFVEALGMFVVLALVAKFLFAFNVLRLGLPLIAAAIINFTMFAWTVGLVMIGLIFRFGTRIQALAWGIIFVFEPLSAAFFPVKVLPKALQTVSWGFPPTYIFENLRGALNGAAPNWGQVGFATVYNIVLLVFGAIAFSLFFRRSKQSGQFARMDS